MSPPLAARRVLRTFFLAGIAAVLGSCFELPLPDPTLEPPVTLNLTVKDGTIRNYQILGHSAGKLWVKDRADREGKVSLIAVEDLAPKDQSVARKIPQVVKIAAPLHVVLHNRQGVAILAKVEGRDATHVRLRKSDDRYVRPYDVPLANLSETDQALLAALPVMNLDTIFQESTVLLARRRALLLAKQKLAQIEAQSKTQGVGGNRSKEMEPQLLRADAEVRKLEKEVEDLEAAEKAAAKKSAP